MNRIQFHSLVLLAALCLSMGCGGLHLYDKDEEPKIIVETGLRPVFSWTPNTAYELNVYEGRENGDGFGVLWQARGGAEFANNLRSPVTYGLPQAGSDGLEAPPLEAGKTYTVVIRRKDPRGNDAGGFTGIGHNYESQKTFVAR